MSRPALFFVLLFLAACAGDVPTPGQGTAGPLPAQQEADPGPSQHAQVIEDHGGLYADDRVVAYVGEVGARVVAASDAPARAFTFTVLDSPAVNAFALPGGYVYVTRGLLALASTEAELASVLGHEVGHIAARHTAQRFVRSVASRGGAVRGTLFGAGPPDPSSAYLQGFSHEQEFEADLLAVRYLRQAGYDPRAASGFLAKLQANSAYEATRPEPEGADIMASHPRTSERVARATRATKALGTEGAPRTASRTASWTGREAFLALVDGMIWGDGARDGLVRGRSFLHPGLGVRFTAPPGFHLVNDNHQVIGRGPGGAMLTFEALSREPAGEPSDILRQWAGNLPLLQLEPASVNGREAATAAARIEADQGPVDVRLAVIAGADGQLYRFMFAGLQGAASVARAARTTLAGFQPLGADDPAARPSVLRVVPVPPEGVDGLVDSMAVARDRRRLFEILNGLAPGEAAPPGTLVKVVR